MGTRKAKNMREEMKLIMMRPIQDSVLNMDKDTCNIKKVMEAKKKGEKRR